LPGLDETEVADASVKHSLLYLPVTDQSVSSNGVMDTLWVDRHDALDALHGHGSRYDKALPFGQHRQLRQLLDWELLFKHWRMARKSRIPRLAGAAIADFVVYFDVYPGSAPTSLPLWLDVLRQRFPCTP
jgi:hypothetical protein